MREVGGLVGGRMVDRLEGEVGGLVGGRMVDRLEGEVGDSQKELGSGVGPKKTL
jgi:hypothetical protein